MKKAMIMLMLVAIMGLLFVPMAFAADPVSKTQVIDGDVPAAINITVSGAIESASFNPSASPYLNADTSLTCFANVAYNVKVNCDDATEKATGRLSEWKTGLGYNVGTVEVPAAGKFLVAPLTVKKTGAATYTTIGVEPASVIGMTSLSATDADGAVQGLSYSQDVGYDDTAATSTYSYHQVMTYTISTGVL